MFKITFLLLNPKRISFIFIIKKTFTFIRLCVVSITILGFIEYREPSALAPLQMRTKQCLAHRGLSHCRLKGPSATHRTMAASTLQYSLMT